MQYKLMKYFEGFFIRGANYNRNKSEKVVHPVVSAELHKAIEQYIERNYRPDNTPRKCLVVDKKGLFRSLFPGPGHGRGLSGLWEFLCGGSLGTIRRPHG